MTDENFSITATTKTAPKLNGAVFREMKDAVLGKNYSLSVVFVGLTRSQTLNRTYRGKDKPTDILSFPMSKTEGEIFIHPASLRRKAKLHGRNEKNYLHFLFIHGLCHLKGMDHGAIMEKEEEKFRKKFKI